MIKKCEVCGAEYLSDYTNTKFCPDCRKKAYFNTYQKPKVWKI